MSNEDAVPEPEERDPRPAPRVSAPPLEVLVPPLAALLGPMGPRAQEALMSCLPDAVARGVTARLRLPEDEREGAETPLEGGLRAQTEGAWGGGSQKSEVRGQKSEVGLALADVLALILRHARPGGLTRALLQLPGDLPAEVLYRIAAVNLGRVSHRIEKEQAGVFYWRLREALGEAPLKPAPELAARALRPMAAHTVRQTMGALHGIDPAVMKAVQGVAYPFEDLTHLSDPELQMVLMGVENRDIALALQTTPVLVQRRLEQSMSSRRKQFVDEEAALAGEVDEEVSLRAKSRIADRARLLYEQGQLHTYFGSIEDAGAAEALRKARQSVYERHAAWVSQWMARSLGARRQSVGVAVAALFLIAGGALFMRYLHRTPEGRSEPPRAGEAAKPNRGIGEPGNRRISPSSVFSHGGGGPGLRISAGSDEGVSGEGLRPGGPDAGKGVRLRMGTVRVVVLDMAATLETPRVRVTGEAGAAYRVRVEIDGTTRLTALRGALNALPSSGKGEATRIEKGLEAVFSPGGSVQVLNADPDAEDLAWLEKNR